MCKVKIGKDVSNQQDLQNLVIAIIFRQQREYNQERIVRLTKKFMTGSAFSVPNYKLDRIVSDNLSSLCKDDKIKYSNGKYTPASKKDITFYTAPYEAACMQARG